MKKVDFINYPKCTTCIKARKWLESNNVNFEARDIVLNNPTEEEIKDYLKRSGKELKKFFNTSGILYREMNLKEKLTTMSEAEMIKLLASNGKLVKRPLIVADKDVLIGFKEEEWAKFFKVGDEK
ncbi:MULTISPECIES: arsenate reductase family protein [Fusobacterium]|uniref:arsenate reductase family protein n=1 Tax=Fusobacterium TaxID=848 RepID=UPI001F4FDFD2|nr:MULTISPECIES: arsenate reductase family protein [Fusobacterium]MDD7392576.1 arsenate reductase family protein [Fusobacteriaceae bacterium]MCI7223407.1 arsenate reductase family protein [Fusobacterium sp.]MDD7410614.1 arsenate reductase family protein [Fusobacteriaceae bacterium]MDY5305329.1 arsenate reductase family protein [Fusobacterium gastrosuis]MDY5714202.1 arsenate reductase family protein [Fusobacterium gastrosuis]